MNEKYKDYLKDLSPELQEKAKDIKTNEELLEFLSDNDIELPEDALDAVAGGNGCSNSEGNSGAAPCAHQSTFELEGFIGYNDDEVGEYYSEQCNTCGAILYYFEGSPVPKAQFRLAKEAADRSLDEAINRFGKANPWAFRG